MKKLLAFYFLSILLLINACTPSQEKKEIQRKTVIIREQADASTLNPVNARDELSSYLSFQLYQPLQAIDFKSGELVGVLAKSPAQMKTDSSGALSFSYEIRPEAQFDNGRAITVHDVIFSIKLNLCPKINNAGGPYIYRFIKGISFDEDQARSFTIHCRNNSVHNQFRSGYFSILPFEVYDSSRVLEHYSIEALQNDTSLLHDERLNQFSEQFNQRAQSNRIEDYQGSGAYRLIKWQRDERIVFERKEDWWGKELLQENTYFIANAEQINYEIINDPVTALNALKSGEIDFMRSLSARNMEETVNNKNLTSKSTSKHGSVYLGFNLKHPILKQLPIRQTIERALPLEKITNTLLKDEVVQNRYPFSPTLDELKNKQVKFPTYDLAAAKEILSNNGWEDSDNDGILDQNIDGQRVDLKLSFHYNAGNELRKTIGLVLKNELQKIGISLEVIGLEWVSYLQKMKRGEFELFINGVSSPPLTPDFTRTFHSKSMNGRGNYANYNNPRIDTLIDLINRELKPETRIQLVKEFQEIIAKDIPYLFLYAKKEIIAHVNDLKGVNIYSLRPHYWAPEFH